MFGIIDKAMSNNYFHMLTPGFMAVPESPIHGVLAEARALAPTFRPDVLKRSWKDLLEKLSWG